MSNYSNANLITTTVPDGSRAIKIGNKIFAFDESSGGGGGNDIVLTKITHYVPYRASFTATSSFTVNDFGTVGEEGYEQNLSGWNGTYTITPATSGLQGIQRIYQKDNEDKFLKSYVEDYGGGEVYTYWYFGPSSTTYYMNSKAYMMTDQPKTGTWYNEDYYANFTLTISKGEITYPTINQELSGKPVTDYNTSTRQYSYDTHLTSYTSFDVQPEKYGIYASKDGILFGNRIDLRGQYEDLITSECLLYAPLNQSLNGRIYDQSLWGNVISSQKTNWPIVSGPNGNQAIKFYTKDYYDTFYPIIAGVHNLATSGDFTIEFWYRFRDQNSLCVYKIDWLIFNGWGDGFSLQWEGTGPLISVNADRNTWYHMCIIHDGDDLKLYANGVLSGTCDLSQRGITYNTVNQSYIGGAGPEGYNINLVDFDICELMVFDYARYASNS